MSVVDQITLLQGQATRKGIYRLGAPNTIADPAAFLGNVGPGTYVAQPDDRVSLASEPADLLQRLYASANPSDRRLFAEALLRLLNLGNARVVARTLAVTSQLSALNGVTSVGPECAELWRGLIHVLRFESHLFTEPDLQGVEAAAASFSARARREAVARIEQAAQNAESFPIVSRSRVTPSPGAFQLNVPAHDIVVEVHSVISRIRYLRLARNIRDNQNPAIDADRQILLSRLVAMGFSDKLSIASNDIEHRAATATTDIDVKTVMDLLRTFYEEFIEEACRKVEKKVGKPAPLGPRVSHFGPYLQYLRDHDFIGPEENELLGKLYRFLSNQGTHRLGSAPEQLRVAHVMVIEWSMLIAGRISTFL